MATDILQIKSSTSLAYVNASCKVSPQGKFNSQRKCVLGMVFAKATAKLIGIRQDSVQVSVQDLKLVSVQ